MSNSNKFWKGVLFGALAGGAVSLLDKQTRLAMKQNCLIASTTVSNLLKNPEKVSNQIKETACKFKTTVKQVSEDLSYIASKVEELSETTPQVTKLLKETKDTFTKNEENEEYLE